MLVDTGDNEANAQFNDYMRVVTSLSVPVKQEFFSGVAKLFPTSLLADKILPLFEHGQQGV